MGDTLFPMPEDPSPRMKWIKANNIQVDDSGFTFKVSKQLTYDEIKLFGPDTEIKAEATTLDFALQELAMKLKIKPYNW